MIDDRTVRRARAVLDWCVGWRGRLPRWQFWPYVAAFMALTALVNRWTHDWTGDPSWIYLVVFAPAVPLVPLSIRRLHDSGRAGPWLLLAPFGIGFIVVLVLLALPGQSGANRYGEPPGGPGAWRRRT